MTKNVIHIPTAPDAQTIQDIQSGVRVIETEAEALNVLAQSLNDTFSKAVEILSAIEGRVIVTGMGKSGHIGNKIAATFASTGTPAFFVHPGEASHGDLGMIVRGDAVVAISNSGESREMADLIEYTRRYAIPLIGITKEATSTLAQRSDLFLLLPNVSEACPNGLAPTTSSTLTLALGDALAIALLERKGFSAEDYKKIHPGGKLGQQLLKVSELMRTGNDIPLVSTGAAMADAIAVMSDKNFGCVGITDHNNTLIGIITDGDLRRHISHKLIDQTVDEIMTRTPKTIAPNAIVAEAMAIMNEQSKITSLFVIQDNKPVGLLRLHDCLQAGII